MPTAFAVTPRVSAPQARRQHRVVRITLVAAAALVILHYLSVQVQLRACQRGGAASPQQLGGGLLSARQPSASSDAGGGGLAESGGAAVAQRRIPRILHQSWKDENVPQRFHKWQVLAQ